MARRRRRWERDRGKERFWRGVVRRWRRSGLSVRDFCAAEGVAEALFYAWRRTIATRDDEAAHERRVDGREAGGADNNGGPALFVPLQVVPAAAPLELVLDGGRVVRVPAGFDAATLRQLLGVLEEAPSC